MHCLVAQLMSPLRFLPQHMPLGSSQPLRKRNVQFVVPLSSLKLHLFSTFHITLPEKKITFPLSCPFHHPLSSPALLMMPILSSFLKDNWFGWFAE